MSIKQKIRFIFWGSLSIASYALTLIFLFKNHDFFLSLITIFIFFIVFHFFYLELYGLKQKYVWAVILIGVVATGFVIAEQSVMIWIANIAFHAAIWRLAYSLYRETEGTTGFDGFTYFSSGGYVFTMMLSLVYGIFIVNSFSQFPWNCDQLNEKTNDIIEFVAKPLRLSRAKTQEISSGVQTLLSSPINDIRLLLIPDSSPLSDVLDITAPSGSFNESDALSFLKTMGISDQQLDTLSAEDQGLKEIMNSLTATLGLDSSQKKEDSGSSNVDKSSKLKNAISSLKSNLVTMPMQENEKLNTTICEITLKTVNEQMKSPTIQYSVILTILLLIYPFIRIIIWIMSFIALFLFELCYLAGIYKKQKEMKEVERIA